MRQDGLIILSYEIKNFFLPNSHNRISISCHQIYRKPKTFQLRYFTRTRKLNGVFPILSLKVDHLSTFVIKPNFNIIFYCVYLGLLEIEMTSWSHYTFTFLIDMLHCYHIIIPNQVDVKLRGCCTSYQKLACFVLYRKLINNFLKNKLCIL